MKDRGTTMLWLRWLFISFACFFLISWEGKASAPMFAADCQGSCHMDSSFLYYWNSSTSAWQASQSSVLSYLQDGRLSQITNRSLDVSTNLWMPVSRKMYHYGEGSQPEQIYLLGYNNDSQQWDTAARQQFIYDTEGNTDTTVYLLYEDAGNWMSLYRYSYDYDLLGNQTLMQYETFNTTKESWEKDYRIQYSYDSTRLLGFVRQAWDTLTASWENDYRKIFEYDSLFQCTTERLEDYDPDLSLWVPQTQISYTYKENGHLSQQRYESWYDSLWKNSADYIYFADPLGNDTLIVFRIWQSPGVWQENYRYRQKYDPCGNLVEESGQYLDTENWVNDYLITRYYSPYYIPLGVTITLSTDVTCFGSADGTALATATGGTPPYLYVWDDEQHTTTAQVTGLTGNIMYHVTVYDAAGDTASDSVYIYEPPPLLTGPIQGDTLVNPGETYIYQVSPREGSVYHWEVVGGKMVDETTGPEIAVCWCRPGTFSISVAETDSAGCFSDPVGLTIYSGTTYQASFPGKLVRIYPNPFTDQLVIELPEDGVYHLFLYDLLGHPLLEKTGVRNSIKLQMSFLKPGYYILFLGKENQVSVRTLMKK